MVDDFSAWSRDELISEIYRERKDAIEARTLAVSAMAAYLNLERRVAASSAVWNSWDRTYHVNELADVVPLLSAG